MDKIVAEFSRNNGLITTETDKKSKSGNRLYEVKCRLCYQRCDEVFLCSRGNLLKHGVSCLCRGGKLSEKAWRVKLTDICSERGLVFLDFVGGFCGNRSKMSALCDKHGPFISVVSDFISPFKSRNCKSCSLLSRANKRTRPVQEIRVRPGTEIVGREGKDMFYRCEICSSDMYSKAGLCDGIFRIKPYRYEDGQKSCRCSATNALPEPLAKYYLKTTLESAGFSFICLVPPYDFSRTKIILDCPHHGAQRGSLGRVRKGIYCQECSRMNQRIFYVNVVSDNQPVAIKFGVTNNYSRRLKNQQRTCKFDITKLAVFDFKSAIACRDFETHLKNIFKCGIVSKTDMPDGWTETTQVGNTNKILKMAKEFGGTMRKNKHVKTS